MTKFHVNPDTGENNQCKARFRPCKYGTNGDNHYGTEGEAKEAGEKILKEKYGSISSLKKETVAPVNVKVPTKNANTTLSSTVTTSQKETLPAKNDIKAAQELTAMVEQYGEHAEFFKNNDHHKVGSLAYVPKVSLSQSDAETLTNYIGNNLVEGDSEINFDWDYATNKSTGVSVTIDNDMESLINRESELSGQRINSNSNEIVLPNVAKEHADHLIKVSSMIDQNSNFAKFVKKTPNARDLIANSISYTDVYNQSYGINIGILKADEE